MAIIAAFVLNYWVASRSLSEPPLIRIPYSPLFLNEVRQGNVDRITSKGASLQGLFKTPVRYPPTGSGSRSQGFSTLIPSFADTAALSKLLEQNQVVINAEPLQSAAAWWETLLYGFGPTFLLIGLLVLLMRRRSALGSFGRSRARRYEASSERVTFDDVAGIEEAKDELTEIVDFLKNPQRYGRLGGRIPRGVLLSGPPGTGKTLLARAVAGEANVPFFSMSASEFIEAIVGVGASRVRDLFKKAKEASPAIVFIDELDSIGRSRSAGQVGGGGGDEREQTLNQILTEMDGFDPSTDVIVIAATNRPDILDAALLRPGRFDRRVAVQPPDRAGRQRILEVHTRDVPLGDDVNLDSLAASMTGMVGADLANLVNEAALLAVRRGHELVNTEDFNDAFERVLLGAERNVVLSLADRERTAYHEAGHAIVGMISPAADPVRKVSIIPRGVALGVTLSSPEEDRHGYDEDYLLTLIRVALGGRAAEDLVFGKLSTGAESDLQQLTGIARQMVGRWGMSPVVGPVTVIAVDSQGTFLPGAAAPSEQTQQLVDQEVRRIVDEAYEDVLVLLREHRSKLDDLALALLERETLDGPDAYAAAGIERVLSDEDLLDAAPTPV
ncbi:MAG TPA: ATP-dependent zinc metalloprotease FtsH [Gaiellaceae bacterium]|nr:ATP-dependent zinc metalloprotease FtsH [Gaiellaceae bacterium]